MSRTWRTAPLALLLSSALALAGCSASSGVPASEEPAETHPLAGQVEVYAALGDSFTAAPLVPDTALAQGCFRSSGNYPAMVAEELGATLRDVSCSGADTGDISDPQVVRFGEGARIRPQIRAVRPDTDLVTIGIGGNDEELYGALVGRCTRASWQSSGSCTDRLGRAADPEQIIERTGRRVTAVLRTVQDAAPRATVVLVGYPRLADADEACPKLPLADEDLETVAGLERRLNEALASAAARAGAEYADLYAISEGHEICAAEPWVNGRRTDQQRALAFHPFDAGQQAAADAVLAVLED